MLDQNKEEYALYYRLSFLKSLQGITNKIHATDNVQQIMLDLSDEIRDQFKAEHMTLYAVSDSKLTIETTVKTGLKSFKDFSLPISGSSIAGYVALTKKLVNIRNVYDTMELDTYTPKLQFRSKVDSRTGFRTRQILAGAIFNKENGEILGVLQLINSREGEAFSEMFEEGMGLICETLAVAFEKRLKPPPLIRTKYDPLVTNGILSAPELALATSAARRQGVHLETTLVDDFQVTLSNIGESLARYYAIPYAPFRSNRVRPQALTGFQRAFVERHEWIVLEENGDRLMIMSTNPNDLLGTDILDSFFPLAKIDYRVTTKRDFYQTVEHFYANSEFDDTLDTPISEDDFRLGVASAAEKALIDRVEKIIAEGFRDKAAAIHIKQEIDTEKNATLLRKNGSIKRISGQVTVNYHVNYADETLIAQE
jgi:hypothetical protein